MAHMRGINTQVFGEHQHRQILIPVRFIPVDVGIADLVQWMISKGMKTEYSCQGEDKEGGMLPFVLFHSERPDVVEQLKQYLDGYAKFDVNGNVNGSYRLEFFSVEKLEEFNEQHFGNGLWTQVAFSAGKE